jgi:hypothetical protein
MGYKSGQMIRTSFLFSASLLTATFIYAATSAGTTPGSIATFTATTENVSGAPDSIRIDILRWSNDADREKILDAWELKKPETAAKGEGRAGAAGRGAAGGRGGAGRGGAAGRGGRGGGEAEATPKASPEETLAKALKGTSTVGYLWSREVAGYAIRYAQEIRNPDGSEQITLLTDRRLGSANNLWKPGGGQEQPYDFTLIELRLKANGQGEGKTSLTGKVALDDGMKTFVVESYDSLPVVLGHVQRQPGGTQ